MIYILIILIVLVYIYKRIKDNEVFWKHLMVIPGPNSYPLIGNLSELLITDGESNDKVIKLLRVEMYNNNENNVYINQEILNLFLCDTILSRTYGMFNENYPHLLPMTRVEGFKRDRELNRIYSPIFKIWFLDVAFVGLSSPEDIELVLSNPKHNDKGIAYDFLHGWLGTGLLTSNGTKWQNRRKILTPAFHFSILQEFVNVFNKDTKMLLEDLEKQCHKPYIEVNKPVTQFTLNSIGETAMGLNFHNDPRCESYKTAVHKCCHILSERLHKPWLRMDIIFSLTKIGKENKKAVSTLHEFSTRVIKERQALFKNNESIASSNKKKKMAMLDLMLTAQGSGADISDEGIREEVDTFMFGGHDTTASGITYSLMTLANEKEIQEEVYNEIIDVLGDSNKQPTFSDLGELKLMERCIKEVLRLYPSAPSIARVAGEDIRTTGGYTIPKGSDIAIFIYDLHRNPKVWDNPEKFDPDRFLPENIAKRHPFSFIPFSAGSRNCIGQKFAMLELKVALCGILRKFKLEPVDKPDDIQYKVDLVLRPLRDVRVKFVPRTVN